MKKLKTILISIIMAVLLTSCGTLTSNKYDNTWVNSSNYKFITCSQDPNCTITSIHSHIYFY